MTPTRVVIPRRRPWRSAGGPVRVLVAAGAALVVLAACGASYRAPEALSLPDPVTASTAATPQLADCGGPNDKLPAEASYPALESLPAPGQMPAGSYMAQIQQRGKLVVGTSIDTKLFSSIDPATNKIEGFDVDMARLVASAIFGPNDVDTHLELRGITYAQRIPKVVSGEVDLVAHTMTINCKRWQQVAFSGVYLWAGQRLLVAEGSGVLVIDDLAGRNVCVSAGGTSADEMRSLKLDPPIIVTEVANQTDCVVLFQRGEVDAIRSDDTVLAGFRDQDPFSEIVGLFLTQEPYGMAMSLEHPEFTAFVNAVLDRAKADTSPAGWTGRYDEWLRVSLGPSAARINVGQPPVTGVPVPDYNRPRPAGS